VQSLAMPLAGRIGWTRTAAAVAALALPLLAVSGIGVRERVSLPPTAAGPLAALGRAVASASVRWLMLAGFSMAAADALTGTSLTYYFPYVATQNAVTFGLYNAVGIAFGFLSLAWLPSRLVRRLPLARALVAVWLAAGLAVAAFRVLPTDAAVSLLALKAVFSLATAAAAALFWSVVAKVAVGCGAGGVALVTALACFSQKAGGAAGASGLAFALSGTGFVPHAELPAAARELVRLAMSALPALLLFLAAWSAGRVAAGRKET